MDENWPYNQIWSEDIKFPGHLHTIEINANSYNAWIGQVCPLIDSKFLSDDAFEPGSQYENLDIAISSRKIIKIAKASSNFGFVPKPLMLRGRIVLGDGWSFGVKTLPYYSWGTIDWLQFGLKRNRLSIYNDDYGCFSRGAVMFTGPVHIPILARGNQIWMSLTPMEIYSLREAISFAEGHVLIAGLGMGWLTQRILENSNVDRVTQIELMPTIIKAFGLPLQQKFGNRLEIVNENIWNFLEGSMDYDSYIFDIWGSFGDAVNDDAFQALKNERNNVWGWGDGEPCDEDEPEFEDQFPNDQACYGKEDPHEWWGLD